MRNKILIGAVCAVIVGGGIFALLWKGGAPLDPIPVSAGDPQASAVVEGIVTPPEVSPNPVEPGAAVTPGQEDTAQALDPAGGETEVVVPIIPEVSKPPEAETSTDPSTHEHVEGANPSEPPKTETPRPPVTEPPKASEPKGGDTNAQGQVWVPGFGWVTPGGDNQVIPGHSDGDINKQVGDM